MGAPSDSQLPDVEVAIRRGLPRVPGGEPWPPADSALVASSLLADARPAPAASADAADAAVLGAAPAPAGPEAATANVAEVALRRGLPRAPGGEPWPPAESAMVAPETAELRRRAASATPTPAPAAEPEPISTLPSAVAPAEPAAGAAALEVAPAEAPAAVAAQEVARTPQPVGVGRGASVAKQKPRTWVWPVAGIVLLALGVLCSRWFLSTPAGADFIERYDGAQPLPADAPVGLPAWLGWAHFFNMFLMALILKTGWQLRRESKPAAFWAPRTNPRAKIPLTQWLHLVLDATWVALGVIFYVLLFATGQWVRIVPTSWDTVPNAVSAGLQYLSLDWPTENPWVHYNALQEQMYFVVVFVAAPLSILSGWRMSPLWPKRWTWMPVKTARKIHFPVMVFFVAFIVIHVALVLLTGVRMNLNAMFAMREDAESWTGVLVFLGAAAAIVAGWFAARPFVVAPVAGKFGKVSQR